MKSIISGIEIFGGRDDIDGLKPCTLQRFGEIVVLAGANGSGKTRLLSAIQSSVEFAKVISLKQGAHEGNYATYVRNLAREAEQYRRMIADGGDPSLSAEARTAQKDEAEAGCRRLGRLLGRYLGIEFQAGVRPSEITLINIGPPQPIEFRNPDQLSQVEKEKILSAQSDSFIRLVHPEDTLLHIQDMIEEFVRITSLKSPDGSKATNPSIESSYNELSELVLQFTGAKLEADRARFRATMDGQSLFEGSKRLSMGQRWLLALSASVMASAVSDRKLLIQLDEPELYLHPAALIMVLKAMQERWRSSQFIIATHSVPLIANLGFENVYWMYQGRAEYGGRKTGAVLNDLLGGDANIDLLQSLTLEPSRLATLTFAVECLAPPTVAESRQDDPQKEQLEIKIRELVAEDNRGVRLLDWGAGKGRLLSCLDQDSDIEVASKINYVAIERDEESAQVAREAISRIYGNSERRCFGDMQSVRDHFGTGFFDVVVLCNVLHEIHPIDWCGVLGGIRDCLDDSGRLLIIEDAALPHGELAHYDGFMIADGIALQKLFGLADRPREIEPREGFRGRLFAFDIPKGDLNICDESLSASLVYINQRSADEIRATRTTAVRGSLSYAEGMRHALHMAQFVNSSLAAQGEWFSIPKG